MTRETLDYVAEAARRLLRDLDPEFIGDAVDQQIVDAAIDRCLAALRSQGPVGSGNRVASSALWEIAGPLLQRGMLQTRARTKPLGYAGDFIMLSQIYERSMCDDPIGKLFDHYFQQLDAPEAVRQRIDQTAVELLRHWQTLALRDYRVTLIGSGPAIELDIAIRRGLAPSEITLLDLDEAALQEATRRLEASDVATDSIHARRENLYRLPGRSQRVLPAESADFLSCLGLFDYLNDEDACAHLATYWQALRGGGEMLVGNFSVACQSRTYMEWIGNWYLLFRTEDDMRRLAIAAGIPEDRLRVTATANRVNLLLHAAKA